MHDNMVWKNQTGLHKPLNTSGMMNGNGEFELDPFIQHHLTSLMLWNEWAHITASMIQHLMENLPRGEESQPIVNEMTKVLK